MTSTGRDARPRTRPPGSARPPTSATSSNAVGCSRCCAPGQAVSSSSSTRPPGYGKTTLAVQWLQELQDEGARRRVARPAPRRQRPALVPLPPAGGRAPGAPDAEDAIAELKAPDRAERRGHPALHALGAAGADRPARAAGSCSPSTTGTSSTTPQVHRALVHLLDFAPPNLSLILTSRTRPAPAAVAAAGAPPAHRGRRRHPAVRPRRDPRVPRRPQRPAAGRRRRRAAVRGHRRLGRGAAARVALAARLRRPRPS